MPRETKRPQQADTLEQQATELPELPPGRLAWVKAYLQGMSASDAYRTAYDTSNWSDEAIWVEASRLKSDPKVNLWLQAASQHNLAECKVTLETHTAELDRLSALAENAGAYGASIKAQELRGRANGLYVDQIKTDDGKVELLQALRLIAETQPELAQALGGQLNVSGSDIMGNDNPVSGAGKPLTH